MLLLPILVRRLPLIHIFSSCLLLALLPPVVAVLAAISPRPAANLRISFPPPANCLPLPPIPSRWPERLQRQSNIPPPPSLGCGRPPLTSRPKRPPSRPTQRCRPPARPATTLPVQSRGRRPSPGPGPWSEWIASRANSPRWNHRRQTTLWRIVRRRRRQTMSLSIDGLAYWEDRAAVAVAASVEVSATG